MKKIKYLIVAIITLMFIGTSVYALECEYSNGKLTAKFTIDKKGSASDATIKGSLNSNDETTIDEESQKIENWKSNFNPSWDTSTKIAAKGKDYYTNHKDCPPYSIFVDRNSQFDFAVFTESHKEEFRKYGKSKQGYAIMPLKKSTKEPEKTGDDLTYESGSCVEYTSKRSCENNEYFACVWNDNEYGKYCNTDNLLYVACGDSFDIPSEVPELVSFLVNLLKIATPIILIFVSVISMVKALAASKDDEIKKAQQSLIKKIIAAVMVFFTISIVQFVIMKVADTNETKGIDDCLTCFLNNDCSSSVYYKTNVVGTYLCTYADGSGSFKCKGNK